MGSALAFVWRRCRSAAVVVGCLLWVGLGQQLVAQCNGLLGTPSPSDPYLVGSAGVSSATFSFLLNGVCPWSVQSNVAFVTFLAATSGVSSGAASAAFSVSPNAGVARQ